MTAQPKVLLVTNDFPPTLGGIQTYLQSFIGTLDPAQLVVYCSTQDATAAAAFDAAAPYTVIRYPGRVMLPTPGVQATMCRLIRNHGIDTVWFGACAPLAIMGRAARRAGATRIVASTHGHEIGWSMIPGARQMLRIIGNRVDTLTYVSEYARRRFAPAFGPHPSFFKLQPGVDLERFRPNTHAGATLRSRYGIPAHSPIIACISRIVPRKGQDQLVEALPHILEHCPDATLLIVGPGNAPALRARAERLGVAAHLVTTGPVPWEQLPLFYAGADVFAMPVRTIGGGLDVEGLGIVFLEAQACGVPVVAGDGGGAPETVIPGETGLVVDGRATTDIADAVVSLLTDPALRARMGEAGRAVMERDWTWSVRGPRLRQVLRGLGEEA